MQPVFVEKHKYFKTLEYDWGAVDSTGKLGFFSSSGFGPIPRFCHLRQKKDEFQLHDSLILRPKVTEPVRLQEVNDDVNIDDWLQVSERGFFAYDWCHDLKKYRLISMPEKALHRSDINDDLIKEFLFVEFDWPYEEDHKNGLVLNGVTVI